MTFCQGQQAMATFEASFFHKMKRNEACMSKMYEKNMSSRNLNRCDSA